MQTTDLREHSAYFLDYLAEWVANLAPQSLHEAAPQPTHTAILSVDVINGFCYEGPLSSPRVAGIVEPITRLLTRAWDYGVHDIVLAQDTHEPEALEFAQWPAHCVRGTSESQTVRAFEELPFFEAMQIIEKNSISTGLNTGLSGWLAERPDLDTFLVVGDCTDLCTYQMAMFLRLDANARQLQRRVIVPADCVQTYDRPLETARQQGGLPHPGDLLHALFLYHMQLNGVEVVANISSPIRTP